MSHELELNVDEIITEISMSDILSTTLLVEGFSDARFFTTRDLPSSPRVIVAYGWENVVSIIEKLKEEEFKNKVIGFIDKDYRYELDYINKDLPIVETDYRDLEISMIESTAFSRVIIELCSQNKVYKSDDGNIDYGRIKSEIYDIINLLSRIRFFSLKNGENLSLRKLDHDKIFSSKDTEIEIENLIKHLNNINNFTVNNDFIISCNDYELPKSLEDKRNISCGHDFMAILGITLKNKFGNNNSKEVSQEKMESAFRMSYQDDDFHMTDMYSKLVKYLR